MKYLRGCKINIKNVADDFYEAYQRCLESKEPIINENITISKIVAIPAFVNGMFACELYLKCLIGNKEIEGDRHNLKLLFDNLDDKHKEKIKAVPITEYNFEELLEELSDGFKTWRYIYEDENEKFGNGNPFKKTEEFLRIYLPVLKDITNDFYNEQKNKCHNEEV